MPNQNDQSHLDHGVTDIYVTVVHKDKVPAFREWLQKMHHLQAQFPGFEKVFVQVPKDQPKDKWVTLLQFDTQTHLDNWLQSSQRKTMLSEAKELVTSQQSHRLFSSFDSWFIDDDASNTPPVWKQALLVLLALFPAVMLETIYLFPHMNNFNPVLTRFIGVIIIVCSFSWILLPATIYFLNWWLNTRSKVKELLGVLLILALYLLEIGIFMLLD
jgi:antibiotic biosynthesis monooxygenase (ABM) superfamily enzyme